MILNNLHLSNFRNYEKLDLFLGPSINVFIGPNGIGKTNLLDAIHFLAMAKSGFGIQDQFCPREGSDFFRLQGIFEGEKPLEVVLKFKQGSRKVLEQDGSAIKKIADHVGLIPIIVSGPQDMQMISGSPEFRRNFLDQMIAQIDRQYLEDLIRYHKILKQKSAELKKQKESGSTNLEMLQTYHQQLSPLNISLSKKRKEIIESGKETFNSFFNKISGENEKAAMVYQSQVLETHPDDYGQENLRKEVLAQRNLYGIHKDDLDFLIDGKPAKKYGSQGQQKSVLVAARLMEVSLIKSTTKRTPIVLLDDIFDRLDRKRGSQLMKLIQKKGFCQVFITDTQFERVGETLSSKSAFVFEFSQEGKIQKK